MNHPATVETGIHELDNLLDGLYIGDNVVWHDDAGGLASVFCLNFIRASQKQKKPIIYVNYDRSPKNLLDKLGNLADDPMLTILDGFTYGKGAGSRIFLNFYKQKKKTACGIMPVENPNDPAALTEKLYDVHAAMSGDVRFVFESVTGMQEIWGGEEAFIQFYSHSCPRLYELNTIAYWVLDKRAHSSRLKAQITQIAQVSIDLTVKRGRTFLSILKAEKREVDNLNKPYHYWRKGLSVTFESETRAKGELELGRRLKALRTKQGISQKELANLVGVTPSTISQIESNHIYPSLSGLLKMAEVLSVEVSAFFPERTRPANRIVFESKEGVDIKLFDALDIKTAGKLLTPPDMDTRAEPYLIEIPPGEDLPSHFFLHKGEELGYVLSGTLTLKIGKDVHTVSAGHLIYLTAEVPSQWRNPGPEGAKILWVKVK